MAQGPLWACLADYAEATPRAGDGRRSRGCRRGNARHVRDEEDCHRRSRTRRRGPVVRRTARILPVPADLSRRTSPNWFLSNWLLKRRKKLRKHRLGTVPTFEPVFEFLAVEAKVTQGRSEEHTSELQSLMRISYAV